MTVNLNFPDVWEDRLFYLMTSGSCTPETGETLEQLWSCIPADMSLEKIHVVLQRVLHAPRRDAEERGNLRSPPAYYAPTPSPNPEDDRSYRLSPSSPPLEQFLNERRNSQD